MKFTIPSKDLAIALQRVRSVILSRSSLPILGNALLTTDATGLTITATNLDQWLSLLIPCEVTEDGSTTLPHARLLLAASHMVGNVSCVTDAKHVSALAANGASVRLNGLSPDEFPSVEKVTGTNLILPIADLQKWLSRTVLFASVPAQSRFQLEGVFMGSDMGRMVMVATDGRRMLCARTEIAINDLSAILPTTAVKALLGMEDDGDVALLISGSALQAKGNAWTLQTKLIEASYPNWKQSMPVHEEFQKEITMDRSAILDALGTVGVTMDDRSRKLTVHAHNGSVMLENETAEIGKTSVELERKNKGAEFKFQVDPRFFADAIRVCDNPEVTICEEGERSALIIKEGNLTSVTMPMRVG